MKELASLFMHSRTQAHVFHLRVKGSGSYAAHLALQAYYEGIVPLIDLVAENYQGKHGLIEFEEVEGLDNNAAIDNIVSYFSKLIEALDKLRKDEKLQSSSIQNQIDTIDELLSSTKYKLENLG
jgi:DNA-binding ferritin-like protein